MPPAGSPPLVSVIVRTMGRPTLPRALECIARQAYRPLEVVLVDASGTGAGVKPFEDIPISFVQRGRLARAQAANAGLDAASGDLIAFLDEDDEIEASHFESLVEALAADSAARVAYSQTKLLDAAGRFQRVFGGPFDRMALFRSNYLAIHAVAFDRTLVTEGARFDESLEVFEDWDFWLQLSMRTAFAFTGQPTAIYHAATGASGAGAGPNLDRATVLAHRERLMRKWETARRALELVSGNR
jgi:hypothetical protein